jgi:acetylornithine deacetylase/succinyl-diaminopimelate desuccinylase-like protein
VTDATDTRTLTAATVELLQASIRNRCVNDGTPTSGFESRNADLLHSFLGSSGTRGFDVQRYEPFPGRASLVARIEGSDPAAPSLCLMGHTDVVPVNESGWTRDPFGGELVDGEVWGRGAVDMLNLTTSMAVAFRHLADTGFRPRGDLVYFAVADEESGSAHGAQWMADHEHDAVFADYVLTENGGLHSGSGESPFVSINVGEKGVAWRRLRVRGTPGHGSQPFRSDNALVKAAAVVQRLADYRPAPRFHELWRERVTTLGVDEDTQRLLLDEDRLDDALAALPNAGVASYLHACTHTTFSCNVIRGDTHQRMKTNVIPDTVELEVDVRTLPGEGEQDVRAHLDAALGDLAGIVEVEIVMNDPATISPTGTPLWESIQRAVSRPFPTSRLTPELVVGFTDARIYRNMGAVAYGAGLFSPTLDAGEYGRRFHGNDERIDVESLGLTTRFWIDVARDFLG